jgi:hypothetical protein
MSAATIPPPASGTCTCVADLERATGFYRDLRPGVAGSIAAFLPPATTTITSRSTPAERRCERPPAGHTPCITCDPSAGSRGAAEVVRRLLAARYPIEAEDHGGTVAVISAT